MKKNIYAFIFARKQSIRIKNKNLKKIGGKTLVEKSIEIAKKIKGIKKVFVSSDSKFILELAKKNKVNIIKRPRKLCESNANEILSWKHAIRYLENKGEKFDYFLSLPPTSPLRSTVDIKRLIEKFSKNKSDITVTVARTNRYPFFNMVKKSRKNFMKIAVKKKNKHFKKNQFYDLTTVGYISSPKYILKTKNLYSGKVKGIEVPRQRAIDIDDPFDFKIAKLLSKNE